MMLPQNFNILPNIKKLDIKLCFLNSNKRIGDKYLNTLAKAIPDSVVDFQMKSSRITKNGTEFLENLSLETKKLNLNFNDIGL